MVCELRFHDRMPLRGDHASRHRCALRRDNPDFPSRSLRLRRDGNVFTIGDGHPGPDQLLLPPGGDAMSRLRSEQGSALMMAVIILFVILGLGTALISTATSQKTSAANEQNGENAYSMAEAALNAQIYQLSQTWPTPETLPRRRPRARWATPSAVVRPMRAPRTARRRADSRRTRAIARRAPPAHRGTRGIRAEPDRPGRLTFGMPGGRVRPPRNISPTPPRKRLCRMT